MSPLIEGRLGFRVQVRASRSNDTILTMRLLGSGSTGLWDRVVSEVGGGKGGRGRRGQDQRLLLSEQGLGSFCDDYG